MHQHIAKIVWPDWYAVEESIYESKGVAFNMPVEVCGTTVLVTFYDTVRLYQDLEHEVQHDGGSLLAMVVVLDRLTMEGAERAVVRVAAQLAAVAGTCS